MKIKIAIFIAFLLLNLASCSTPEKKAAKAEAEYTEEKTATLKEYKECVKSSGGDDVKMKQCEALLKAVEAVEGGK